MGKMKQKRPDVIVLDLEMPRMDGLTFLRKIVREDPIPVVICSALTGPDTSIGLQALEEGAVDVVTKPRLGVRDFLHESAVVLIDAVRAAARSAGRKPIGATISRNTAAQCRRHARREISHALEQYLRKNRCHRRLHRWHRSTKVDP